MSWLQTVIWETVFDPLPLLCFLLYELPVVIRDSDE
jgi:hypothetical protein